MATSLLLLLETSTASCRVALAQYEQSADGPAGSCILAEAEETTPMRHTARLMPMIEEMLSAQQRTLSDLSAIAVSAGPGSYTALRAGLSTAKGLCTVLDIPLLLVDTQRALAAAALVRVPKAVRELHVLLPARRTQWYYARYSRTLDTLTPACLIDLGADDTSRLFAGLPEYQCVCGPQLPDQLLHGQLPALIIPVQAANLLTPALLDIRQGQFADLVHSSPTYVRQPFITRAKPRL